MSCDVLIDCGYLFNYFINIIKLLKEYNNCEEDDDDGEACLAILMINYNTITELIDEELRL